MTWRYRIQGVVLASLVLGALALSAGASWIDDLFGLLWGAF